MVRNIYAVARQCEPKLEDSVAELVTECPRCGANHITFDLIADTLVAVKYNWQQWYEAFCVCRHCKQSTVFVLAEKGIEDAKSIRLNGLAKYKGTEGVRIFV